MKNGKSCKEILKDKLDSYIEILKEKTGDKLPEYLSTLENESFSRDDSISREVYQYLTNIDTLLHSDPMTVKGFMKREDQHKMTLADVKDFQKEGAALISELSKSGKNSHVDSLNKQSSQKGFWR
jgi:hypothetical protein